MEVLEISSGIVWFPSGKMGIATFFIISILFVAGLSVILVPIHEFIHMGIASIEGYNTLDCHWGQDTSMWLKQKYTSANFIGVDDKQRLSFLNEHTGEIWGVCIVPKLTTSQEVPHSLYEMWWVGVVIYLGLLLGYISMALLTKKQYVVYADGMWGEQDSNIPSERK